uniref:Uncharacterized protein n=1 Tax=Romanomermis culicivorax TaxID=13658 RepID=A0A915K1K5_ROMCU
MVCVHITNRGNQDDNERMEFDASVLLVQCPNEYAYNVQPCLLNKIDICHYLLKFRGLCDEEGFFEMDEVEVQQQHQPRYMNNP